MQIDDEYSAHLKSFGIDFKETVYKFYKEQIAPKRILFSWNRTIVFWKDGTKTIVKRPADKQHDEYASFTAALSIKLFGSNSKLKRVIDKTKEYHDKQKKGGMTYQ